MNMALAMLPPTDAPLVVRGAQRQQTVSQAAGYGSTMSAAQIAQVMADQHAALTRINLEVALAAGKTSDVAWVQARVELRVPDIDRVIRSVEAPGQRLTPEAALVMTMTLLSRQVSDTSLDSLRSRLEGYRNSLNARAERGERLSAELQRLRQEADAAAAAADSASNEAAGAEAALDAAREEVNRARAELEATDPADPSYAAKQAALATAQARLAQTQAARDQAADQLGAAGRALGNALAALHLGLGDTDRFNAQSPVQVPGTGADDRLTDNARAELVLALLAKLTKALAKDQSDNQSRMLIERLEAQKNENLERSRKYLEEQERARAAEKSTGCAGKIFGWIKAAVAVVASAALVVVGTITMNPVIVAAGVFGLLLAADQVAQMATGFSVIGWLSEQLGTVISKALEALGVDPKLARQIGSIAATIIITAVIIAISVALGNAAAAGQAFQGVALLIKQASEVAQVIAQIAGLAGQLTVGIGQIVIAGIEISIAELLDMMERLMFANEALKDMLEKLMESVTLINQGAFALVQQMGEVIAERDDTARSIIQRMVTHA